MGLDMYLSAKYSIYSFDGKRKKIKVSGVPGLDNKKLNAVEQEAMYWRKANAIHGWFVRNVQNGHDDCREYPVSREELGKLLKDVELVLASRRNDGGSTSQVRRKLPPVQGFFFGSDVVDEYYWEGMERTASELKRVLKMPDGWDFYYQSSW